MVSAIRAGLLNEKTARAVADDLPTVLAASRELTELLEGMMRAKQQGQVA
jgi:hypothetical protein